MSSAGTVTGLSAAGITSGLAAIGGQTMLTGAAVLIAVPAAAAAAVGFGVYKLSRRLRKPPTPVLAAAERGTEFGAPPLPTA